MEADGDAAKLISSENTTAGSTPVTRTIDSMEEQMEREESQFIINELQDRIGQIVSDYEVKVARLRAEIIKTVEVLEEKNLELELELGNQPDTVYLTHEEISDIQG